MTQLRGKQDNLWRYHLQSRKLILRGRTLLNQKPTVGQPYEWQQRIVRSNKLNIDCRSWTFKLFSHNANVLGSFQGILPLVKTDGLNPQSTHLFVDPPTTDVGLIMSSLVLLVKLLSVFCWSPALCKLIQLEC